MSRRLRAPASCAYSKLSSISRVRSLRTPRSARCSAVARSSAAQGSRLASWRNTVFWCGMAWLLLMSDASGNASDQVESRPRSLYSKNEPDRRGRQQRLEIAEVGLSLTCGGIGQTSELRADGRHPQRLAVLTDGLVLKLGHHAVPAQGPDSSVS